MGFVVDIVALEQVFFKYSGFLYQFLFHRLLTFIIITYHLGLYDSPEVAAVPSRLSLTPLRIIIKGKAHRVVKG
jgi:hypothetical protein